ncbi:hypothetical protein AC578_2887 [Pseudocercospora eumusae]|uniref:PNPLA domain-containing protein n=1 Tax=Pseudocercospora eumusae TaxID=321146 RepID=A0A139GY94_9PEZI|nr:hypothetical protein AC578_2887 [Pseudocercospora eumusae]KXS95129.1 hypothetical protein AC578_2887 [Pseudocercospora eumusae]
MASQACMLSSGEQSALIGSADSGIVIPRTSPKCGRRYNSDSSAKSPWRRKVILSLDGGGIRGYASLKILERLMQKVEQIEQSNEVRHHAAYSQITSSAAYPWDSTQKPGDSTMPDPNLSYHPYNAGFRPHHYFDYFFGTSTGGLSSIMLGRLQMSVSTALEQYDIVGNSVFAHGRPYVTALGSILVPKYRSRDMEQALSKVLQNGLAGRTLTRPVEELALQDEDEGAARTVVVSHGPSTLGGVSMPYLPRSYEHPKPSTRLTGYQEEDHLNPGPIPSTTIIEAARATSAAPTYFSEKNVGGLLYMDGAVDANNPVQLAYNEVTQMHHSQQPQLIISIGTGEAAEWQPHSAWRILKTVKRTADHISDFARNITDTEGPHKQMRAKIRDLPKSKRPHYIRFNVPSSSGICDIGLDEWQPKKAGHGRSGGQDTKATMEAAVNDYCDSKAIDDRLEECAKILVEVRRERAETERWERFALHESYSCPEEDCEAPSFHGRQDLRQHLFDSHGIVRHVWCRGELPSSQKHAFACIWHDCGDYTISTFDRSQSGVSEHLDAHTRSIVEAYMKSEHGVPDAKVMTSEDFEDLLDRGRDLDVLKKRRRTNEA